MIDTAALPSNKTSPFCCEGDVRTVYHIMLFLVEFFHPAVFIRCFAPLYRRQLIIKMLSNLADLKIIDDIILTFIAELSDRRYDCCRARASGFLELAVFAGVDKLVYA